MAENTLCDLKQRPLSDKQFHRKERPLGFVTRGPWCKELRDLASTRNTQHIALGILLGKEDGPVLNVWSPTTAACGLQRESQSRLLASRECPMRSQIGAGGCERGVRCASNGSATSFVVEPRWVPQQEGWTADLLDLGGPMVASRKDRPGIRHTEASQAARVEDG